jgi:hypothetical protein
MHVDLRGMNAAEAEAEVENMIDAAQQVALQDFLITCVEMGLTEAQVNRELAQQQAELDIIREQLLAKFRAFVARGGKQLH